MKKKFKWGVFENKRKGGEKGKEVKYIGPLIRHTVPSSWQREREDKCKDGEILVSRKHEKKYCLCERREMDGSD